MATGECRSDSINEKLILPCSAAVHIVREPDQMSVPLLVANAIIPFWTALDVRIEKKCDSQSDSVALRFYKHF